MKKSKKIKTPTLSFEEKTLVNTIISYAEGVIETNAQSCYCAQRTPQVATASNLIVHGLGGKSAKLYKQALRARHSYEMLIDKKYLTYVGVDSDGNKVNFEFDVREHLISRNVPQRTQVALGIFDHLVSAANPNFHHIVIG